MLQTIEKLTGDFVGLVWGVPLVALLVGSGIIFSIYFGFPQLRFTEVTLSLRYRDVKDNGTVHGGPMFVIKNALSKNFQPLAWLYAFFVILSSFGAGNMFQSNQMASVIRSSTGLPEWASGLIFCAGAFMILIGGIKRIAKVTEKLVPAMVGLYILGALFIIVAHIGEVPAMFQMIFAGAFGGTAAVGGFAGAAFKDVMIMGIRRATFSNEAGMGSAAMAHSAAKSTPIQEGIVALLEPFIDTIVVCSITAIALLLTGAWSAEGVGAGSEMTAYAFESVMGPAGRWLVTATVTLFAFSTLISWSYYGEQGVTFVFGDKWIPAYRYVFIVFIFIGAVAQLGIVLNLSDAVYGLLAIPNMIACYMLLPKVKEWLDQYKADLANGVIKKTK